MQQPPQVWKHAIYSGIAFGVLFALVFGFVQGWLPPRSSTDVWVTVLTAVITGALFGTAMGMFAGSKTVAQQTAIDLPEGEIVEYEGGANHFLNAEARGGRLYLTNWRLIFQPHRINLQGASVSIPRSDVAGISKFLTLGLIPNGMQVARRGGTPERFVVMNRAEWMRRIGEFG